MEKSILSFFVGKPKEQIRIAFEQAEKEVNDLRQRTSEGIKTAELNSYYKYKAELKEAAEQ